MKGCSEFRNSVKRENKAVTSSHICVLGIFCRMDSVRNWVDVCQCSYCWLILFD